ncbi:MAG: hypothetical protein LBJ72_13670 [Dysgonamonadaceae bacterium]|jgi:hypothetical protein|nr:hypothetical protein [Dysgonamonadaceae bacterium]
MGQFLAIGLICEAEVARVYMNNAKATVSDVIDEMQKSQDYDMSMYDVAEQSDIVKFTLKKEILQNNLYSFLREFYPFIYPDANSEYSENYQKIFDLLETDKFDECMNIAENRGNMAFRFDYYAEPQFIYVGKTFKNSIRIETKILNLYYGNGKIVTEGICDIERIFEYCIRRLFKDQPVAQSLRLYISG